MSILFLLFCVGVAMWYLTWKKSEDWWIKGVVLGGAFYVVLAWVIPFAFNVLAAVIPAMLAIAVIAFCIGIVAVAFSYALKRAHR